MKCQNTISQLILTGARMYWYNKVQKKIPVCKMSRIKLGHRWSDLCNISPSYTCSSIHDSQIEMFYILIAISPLTDQTIFWKEEANMEKTCFYYVDTFFISCFTTPRQFPCKNTSVKLQKYRSLTWTRKLENCTHKEIKYKNQCNSNQTQTHGAQSSGVITICVHTLISIQYRWANSLRGSQPASDLHNIPKHTLQDGRREVCLRKSHNIFIFSCLWGVSSTWFTFSHIQKTNMIT